MNPGLRAPCASLYCCFHPPHSTPAAFPRMIHVVTMLCLMSLWGCTSAPYKALKSDPAGWQSLQQHMINFGAHGGIDSEYAPDHDIYPDPGALPAWSERICRAARGDKKKQGVNLTRSVDRVMQGFDHYAQQRLSQGRQARALLFIHGGLVSLEQGIVEAEKTIAAMGPDPDFYPIFLNWETGIPKSYFDHLTRIRKGERVGYVKGYATAPFILFADLGRAVGRLPIFLYDQTAYISVGQRRDGRFHKASHSVNDDARIPQGWQQSVELPPESDKPSSNAGDIVGAVIPGALRVVTTPIADFAGTGAYENMRRRSRLMFLQDADFKQMKHLECGGLSRLMRELRAYELLVIKQLQRDDPLSRNRGNDDVTQLRALQVYRRSLESSERQDVESKLDILGLGLSCNLEILPITVIAHSMGGIVTNELLHRNSDLYFDRVVYMAAANSTKDFAALALPYLEANPTTHFYSLSLHPFREVNEVSFYHTVPEGSLLTWLDRFLINSRSKLDHTLGTWNNAAQSLSVVSYLEGDVRDRLVVKVFDSKDTTPQKHGDFNDPPCSGKDCEKNPYQGAEFWKPAFWEKTP